VRRVCEEGKNKVEIKMVLGIKFFFLFKNKIKKGAFKKKQFPFFFLFFF